jgi:energy-coupling factor transporter ATP-binding protein EcfA2
MHHDPAHRTQAAQVDPVRLHFIAADFLRLAVTRPELRQLLEDGLIRSNAGGAAVNAAACDLSDDYDVTPLGAALLAWAPLGGGSAANGVSLGGTQCRILTCQPERAHAVSPAAVLRVCVVPPAVQERGPVPSEQGEDAVLTSHAHFTALLARDMPWASEALVLRVANACVPPVPSAAAATSDQLRILAITGDTGCGKRRALAGIGASVAASNYAARVETIDLAAWRARFLASESSSGPFAALRQAIAGPLQPPSGSAIDPDVSGPSVLLLHRIDALDDLPHAATESVRAAWLLLASYLRQECSAGRRVLIVCSADSASPIARGGGALLARWGQHGSAARNWTVVPLPLALDFEPRRRLWQQHLAAAGAIVDEQHARDLAALSKGWALCDLHDPARTTELIAATNAPTAETVTELVALRNRFAQPLGMDADVRLLHNVLIAPLRRRACVMRYGDATAAERFRSVPLPKGVLVTGPSGCGKSLLLKHIAAAAAEPLPLGTAATGTQSRNPLGATGVTVIAIDTLSLVEKEVGASERNVHALFERARACAPCVVLLDHIDAIGTPRGRQGADSSSQAADRLLSTLLVELDGVRASAAQRAGLVVVCATAPSADALDPALCRPGRLDLHVAVDHPTPDAGAAVLERVFAPLLDAVCDRVGPPDSTAVVELRRGVASRLRMAAARLCGAGVGWGAAKSLGRVARASFADVEGWGRSRVATCVKLAEGDSAQIDLAYPTTLAAWSHLLE